MTMENIRSKHQMHNSSSKKTLRVLHLFSPSFGFRFSGHEKRWMWQFETWSKQEIQHLVLYPENYTVKNAFPLETSHRNKTYNRKSRALWVVKTLISIVKNKGNFDLLHVHTQNWGGLLAGTLTHLLGRKSIYEISLMSSDNPSALRMEKYGSMKLAIFRNFNRFLCTTSLCAEDCIENGIPKDKIELIVSSVDSNLYKPISAESKLSTRVKYHFLLDKKILLFVGSIKKRKGIDIILEIYEKLKEQRSDCILLLIGPDSSKQSSGIDDQYVNFYKERYKSQIEDRSIIFTGRVDSREILAEYYQIADIFIFSSINEGLPNVILESMASGLPTIATNLRGITDFLIKDQKNGFLFESSNIEYAVSIINMLLGDPNLSRRISFSARSYIMENHSFQMWQNKIVEMYQNLVAGS